jgi:hypothetical protein
MLFDASDLYKLGDGYELSKGLVLRSIVGVERVGQSMRG